MKFRLLIGLFVCGMVLSCSAAFGMIGVSENFGQGQVDWENGVIIVTGEGAPPENASKAAAPLLAKRAAIMDAYRNAAETVAGIRIRAGSYVKDATSQSDEISGHVDGFIRGGQFEKPVYDSEGRCTIVLHLPVGGHKGLASILYDQAKQMTPESPIAPEITADSNVEASYTGIIIDARNYGIRPALYPQIFDTDGYLLYGQSMVNITDPGFSTIVAYSKTVDNAKTMARAGSKPLIIKATGAVKAANGEITDVIIGSEDSNTFRKIAGKNELLAKAAVIIVIN
jgi:hypothetical protein